MTDPYDQAHQETGSSNISKATPEWQEVLKQAREAQVREESSKPVLHIAYELVNQSVRSGVPWAKCPNCGSPFRSDWAGRSGTCSLDCFDDYMASLNMLQGFDPTREAH